jgi:hypothetical protein
MMSETANVESLFAMTRILIPRIQEVNDVRESNDESRDHATLIKAVDRNRRAFGKTTTKTDGEAVRKNHVSGLRVYQALSKISAN